MYLFKIADIFSIPSEVTDLQKKHLFVEHLRTAAGSVFGNFQFHFIVIVKKTDFLTIFQKCFGELLREKFDSVKTKS